MVPSLSLLRVVQKRDRNLVADPALPELDFVDGNPRYYALPKEIGPQPDSVVRPTVNRSGVRSRLPAEDIRELEQQIANKQQEEQTVKLKQARNDLRRSFRAVPR